MDARRHPQPGLISIVIRRGLTLLAAALLLAGCGERKPPKAVLELRPVTFAELPGWSADRPSEAVPALQRSCARFAKLAADRSVGPGGLAGTIAEWQPLCAALASLPPGDDAARGFFETWFVPFLASSSAGGDEGTFTGYYEMELRGSRVRDDAHPAPIYRIPDDLVTVDLGDFRADYKGQSITGRVDGHRFKPYYSREQIEGGVLAGQGAELAWAESPVDTFNLQIQGSGKVQFDDGTTMSVGFAATNGQPLYMIGRALLENGTFKKGELTAGGLTAWLKAHGKEGEALMNRNRSYVFFREIKGDTPIGAQGVALTAGRSMAVDPSYLPLGGPLWLDTTWPRDTPQAGQPLQRLMIAQDTGGAIKGPVRGDVFWGTGDPALAIAGPMQQTGRYFLLLPKPAADRRLTLIARGMLP